RRDHPHPRSRFDERLQLAGGHTSASDEDDGASREVDEERKQLRHRVTEYKTKKARKLCASGPWSSASLRLRRSRRLDHEPVPDTLTTTAEPFENTWDQWGGRRRHHSVPSITSFLVTLAVWSPGSFVSSCCSF